MVDGRKDLEGWIVLLIGATKRQNFLFCAHSSGTRRGLLLLKPICFEVHRAVSSEMFFCVQSSRTTPTSDLWDLYGIFIHKTAAHWIVPPSCRPAHLEPTAGVLTTSVCFDSWRSSRLIGCWGIPLVRSWLDKWTMNLPGFSDAVEAAQPWLACTVSSCRSPIKNTPHRNWFDVNKHTTVRLTCHFSKESKF